MFTPSPDDIGRNGEWSIENNFDTCGLKQSFSVMHDEEARKDNSLDAEWDKKSDIEEKKIEGYRNTKGTRWDKKEPDTKACKDLHWEPKYKRIKIAPEAEPIYKNAAFVSTVINRKTFKVGSKSSSMLGDTCASNQFVMSDEAMYDCKDIHESINGIDKEPIYATKVGKLVIAIKPADEAQAEVMKVFENVKFVPNLSENLFAITAELSKGAGMQSNADMNIFLFYPDDTQIVFDCHISTRNGWVPCFKFIALREKALLACG